MFGGAHVKFAVKSIRDIQTKAIPFFKKYPLCGKKRKILFSSARQMKYF
jgi:hypothetical protein